jgi:hypothetical protein
VLGLGLLLKISAELPLRKSSLSQIFPRASASSASPRALFRVQPAPPALQSAASELQGLRAQIVALSSRFFKIFWNFGRSRMPSLFLHRRPRTNLHFASRHDHVHPRRDGPCCFLRQGNYLMQRFLLFAAVPVRNNPHLPPLIA